MLVLSRKPKQTIHIGDSVVVSVVRVRGSVVQLSIEAPREIPIVRGELLGREDPPAAPQTQPTDGPAPSHKQSRTPADGGIASDGSQQGPQEPTSWLITAG